MRRGTRVIVRGVPARLLEALCSAADKVTVELEEDSSVRLVVRGYELDPIDVEDVS